MLQIRKIAKISNLLMIPVIMLLFFNASNNKHSHILADGQIINHAHPFKSDNSTTPFQNHKHTSFELIFLSFLSNSIGVLPFLLAFSAVFFLLKKEELIVYTKRFVQKSSIEKYIGRAPPVLI